MKGTNKHKTVLGIDPGCGRTGVAVVRMFPQSGEIIEATLIESKKSINVSDKLSELHESLGKILKKYKPDVVGIESIFLFKNQKTVVEVAEGRGVALLAVAQNLPDVPIIDVSPPQVKMAVCGYGNASKDQVGEMVKRLFGLEEVLKPDDVSDAAAVAWAAYQLHTSPINKSLAL